MKVFVDDVRDPPDDTWVLLRTGESAIAFLSTQEGEIDILSLDHDLGEGKKTGYDVLKWIEAQVFLHNYMPPKEILIHTDNPAGRKNMELAIGSIYNISSR